MKSAKLLLLSSLALLTGCGPATTGVSYSYQDKNSPAETKLVEAAVSVSHSLNELAAIEKANNPKIKLMPPPNPGSIGMAQQASVNWNGPIEPLVNKLAKTSGYSVRILGRRPAIPVIVSVNMSNATVADILRNTSYQAVNRANISIYPSRRIIELRYLNT